MTVEFKNAEDLAKILAHRFDDDSLVKRYSKKDR